MKVIMKAVHEEFSIRGSDQQQEEEEEGVGSIMRHQHNPFFLPSKWRTSKVFQLSSISSYNGAGERETGEKKRGL